MFAPFFSNQSIPRMMSNSIMMMTNNSTENSCSPILKVWVRQAQLVIMDMPDGILIWNGISIMVGNVARLLHACCEIKEWDVPGTTEGADCADSVVVCSDSIGCHCSLHPTFSFRGSGWMLDLVRWLSPFSLVAVTRFLRHVQWSEHKRECYGLPKVCWSQDGGLGETSQCSGSQCQLMSG